MSKESDKNVLEYRSPEPTLCGRSHQTGSGMKFVLVCAAISVALGLLLGDDLGSGRVILNPITYVCGAVFLLCAGGYMVLRISQEERMPIICRVVSAACSVLSIPAIVIAYSIWNRRRAVPPTWTQDYSTLMVCVRWICGGVLIFAVIRAIGWLTIFASRKMAA